MRSSVWLAVIAGAACLFGCGRFLGDGPSRDRTANLGAGDLQPCLAGFPEAMADYFKARSGADRLDAALVCADRALDLFQEKARFSRPGVWSRDETREFVDRYFKTTRPLAGESLTAVFRLKRSWFGGSETEMTRAELQRMRAMIGSLRATARALQPFADLYAVNSRFDLENPNDHARFDRALDALASSAREFAAGFGGQNQSPMPVRGLLEILSLFQVGLTSERLAPVLEAAKSIAIAPPAEVILPSEWGDVLETVARLYGERLRYAYFIKDRSWLDPHAVDAAESMARRTFRILRVALGRREPNESVRMEEWQRLLKALSALDLLPSGLRSSSLEAFLQPFFQRMLRFPGAPMTSERPEGLGPAQLARLDEVFTDWLDGHRLAVEAPVTAVWSTDQLKEPLGFKVAAQRLAELFTEGRPLAWRDGRLHISAGGGTLGRTDLATLNLVRWLSTWVVESYGDVVPSSVRGERPRTSMGEMQAQEFYEHARPLGVDLGFMDPRVLNAGARSYMEATLFTSVATPGDRLTPRHAAEFLALIMSGGSAADALYQDLTPECATETVDILGHPTLEAQCFRRGIRARFAQAFAHLPGMVAEMSSADDRKWDELLNALENASRSAGVSSLPVESSEIRVMAPVLQYAESLAVKYDRQPLDGSLSELEIWEAFPVFRSFIRRLSAQSGLALTIDGLEGTFWGAALRRGGADSVLGYAERTIFTYLVWGGEPPRPGLSGGAWLLFWGAARQAIGFSADRTALVRIIASINVMARERRLRALKSWYTAQGPSGLRRLPALARAASRALGQLEPVALSALTEAAGCSVASAEAFRELVAREANTLTRTASGGAATADVFAANLSRAVRSDPVLSLVCLPPL